MAACGVAWRRWGDLGTQPPTPLSSPGSTGDPVFQRQSCMSEEPRRTGCPGQAGARQRRTRQATFSRHLMPELCQWCCPRKSGGRRECRAPLHPRSRVPKSIKKTHTSRSQVQPNTSGIPRAMLDDLFRALLGVPGVLVTVPRKQLAGLTPASGCRDHTASSNASRALRRCAQIASIASPPHVS